MDERTARDKLRKTHLTAKRTFPIALLSITRESVISTRTVPSLFLALVVPLPRAEIVSSTALGSLTFHVHEIHGAFVIVTSAGLEIITLPRVVGNLRRILNAYKNCT
jgi:hypothetical protein